MDIASYIDHTALKPETTPKEIEQLCEEALQYHFASVCVSPSYVPLAYSMLRTSGVKVCTVIGFSSGATSSSTKYDEADTALMDGASELDMVIHIGQLKAHNYAYVEGEIAQLAEMAVDRDFATLKVIIETPKLTDPEKHMACHLAKQGGAHFVKTCTGFGGGGATIADIRLMRAVVGPDMGIKASGGIKTLAELESMVNAGATRIGTSNGGPIMLEALARA